MRTPASSRPTSAWLFIALALVSTIVLYWPSVHGGFVFDDYPNILDNREVHVASLDWTSLKTAALSSPSPVLIRPLAMVTFGLDWYFASGNAFEMKLVNLAIHLANGVLLFLLVRRIARIAARRETDDALRRSDLLALFVAGAWLIAPINFTAVAYIVQRMESLSQLFVLAGLHGYIAARERMQSHGRGLATAIGSIVVATIAGTASKESALLLPLYAFVAEWVLFDFGDRRGGRDPRIVAAHVLIVVVPSFIALAWALRHLLPAAAWSGRPFTLVERLLTESRILLDYVRWSLLPSPNALALYHDQIALSRSLVEPWTTLPAVGAIAAAAIAVPLLRRAKPLVALGIGWFLSAHLLTGTIVPLELVFEHRNYFASIGLYLAFFALLVPADAANLRVARFAACAALLALFATVTWIRAQDWRNPITFALSEARKNPDSPRTAYELGRLYVVLSHYEAASPLIPEGYAALERAATMRGADALPDQGLLLLSARLKRPADEKTWDRLRQKLALQPLSAQNISALHSLSQCAVDGDCAFPSTEMVATFAAALTHVPANLRVLSIYANYAINVLGDTQLALNLTRDAFEREPQSLQARRNLIMVLQAGGRHADAVELFQSTLRDLPEARTDRSFRAWAEQLLQDPASRDVPQLQNTQTEG